MFDTASQNEIPATPKIETAGRMENFDPDERIPEFSGGEIHPAATGSERGFDPDERIPGPPLSFKGFTNVEKIADIQFGGTCWAEALQKTIQLVVGDKEGELNNLSSEIIAKVFDNPKKWDAVKTKNPDYTLEKWNIPSSRYPDMLKEFGVEAENRSFSHDELKTALANRRPVLVRGDVKFLDAYKGDSGPHVLVAVDWDEAAGKYVLLDSNFPNVYKVSPETLQKFATGDFRYKLTDFFTGGMTVVKTPSKWPDWRVPENGQWHMFVDGREVKHPQTTFDEFINKTNPAAPTA